MKKATFLLPALAALLMGLTMTSCHKEYFGDTNTRAMTVTVKGTDWFDDLTSPYFYAEVPWDAITLDVLNFGNVAAYLYDGDLQCPLPHTVVVNYTDINNIVTPTPETFTYDLSPGLVKFRLMDHDGDVPRNTASMAPVTFRVVVTMPVEH
ncbi:MAG: hypothetical protein IK058_01285 [Bacteroidales bacterium]|nr:hypothetical protein [Bacteroidales bacterium]